MVASGSRELWSISNTKAQTAAMKWTLADKCWSPNFQAEKSPMVWRSASRGNWPGWAAMPFISSVELSHITARPAPPGSPLRPVANALHGPQNTALWLLLGTPLAWFVVFYLLPLFAFLFQSVPTFD